MPESLLQKLKRTTRLPSPPGTALEILRLSQQEDVDIGELADTLAADPALSVRLLKYANSPIVGSRKGVTSIRQAVTLLGLRSVRLMALSFSLVKTNDQRACPGFDYGRFWSHSVACAVSTRHLARLASQIPPEEAFAAGLLTHFGKLVLAVGMPHDYARILQAVGGTLRDTRQRELAAFGVSYPDLGADLLEDWGIPARLAGAVRLHRTAIDHSETVPLEHRAFAFLLANAVRIADFLCSPRPKAAPHSAAQTGDETERPAEQPPASDPLAALVELLVASGLFATADAAQEAVHTIRKEFHELASILSLSQGTVDNAEEIQAQAGEVLGELSLVAQLKSDAIEKENRGLQQQAFTDAMTGIANRAAFDRRLIEAWHEATRKRCPLGLIMLDVDHFKKFNDAYGHRTGDEVLKAVGCCLSPCVRSVDFVARYGGEEFAVILPNVDRLTAAQICVKLRTSIENNIVHFEGNQHRVTVSIGAAILVNPGAPSTPQTLVEVADQLLYKSKQKGRNCCSMRQVQGGAQPVAVPQGA